MARLVTASRPFTILVANLEGSGDPSRGRNPTKLRTGFRSQLLSEIARQSDESKVGDPQAPGIRVLQGLLAWTTPGVPIVSTGDITVTSNDFTDAATLYLGPYTVTSNEDFTPGGSTALTAVALALAIDALPQFTASAVGSTVTLTGPVGPNGNFTRFSEEYRGAVANYTLSPAVGYLAGAEPVIGAPDILG